MPKHHLISALFPRINSDAPGSGVFMFTVLYVIISNVYVKDSIYVGDIYGVSNHKDRQHIRRAFQ